MLPLRAAACLLSSFRSSKPFFKDLIVDKLPFSL
jgi:hypothetical protein